MDPKDTPTESAEELEAEQKDLAEVKEDAVRDEIIEDYGFDSEDDKERIDKMVKKEMGHRSKLSKTIGQKVKYRDSLKKDADDTGDPAKKKETATAKDDDADLDGDAKFEERMNKRDLAEMEYPDEIKTVIDNVSKLNKVSVKKALSDPYVTAKIEAWKKAEGVDDSALSKKDNKGNIIKSNDEEEFDGSPPDIDVTTEEGRKEYDKWKADMIKKGY